MANVTIPISIVDGKVSIPDDLKKVKIKKKEKVTWTSGQSFGIGAKPDSPLKVVVPPPTLGKDGWETSYTFNTEEGAFRYDITAPGATTLDPEIEIVP